MLPRRRWVVAAQVALVVSAIDVLVGCLLIPLVDAETVFATAPILFAAGLVLIVASWRLKLMVMGILGLAHCSICLFFTMLVNVRNWGPRDAVIPFAIMGGVYLLAVTVPVTVVEWRRLRAISAAATTVGSAQHDLPSSRPVAEDTA